MWSRFRFGRAVAARFPHAARQHRAAAVAPVAAIAVMVAVGWLAAGCGSRTAGAPPDAPGTTRVVRVIDGDTIVVRADGRDERVRLIGVDTPETKHPTKPVQCFGQEASAFTTSLLPRGTPVRLEQDAEPRDDYGRLLAYVSRVDDGVSVNAELVRRGFARPLTIPPNVAHAEEYRALAARARDTGQGLWQACGDVGGSG